MSYEVRAVLVSDSAGGEHRGEWRMWDEDDSGLLRLDLLLEGAVYSSRQETYFEAMTEIRQMIEPIGFHLVCYGASRNVYPSPMILSMGDAVLAYRLTSGVRAKTSDLVNIFDSGDDVVPSTVQEQLDYYNRWFSEKKQ